MPVSDPDVSRLRLIRDARFLEADRREIALRRGRHNRLDFAYPVSSQPSAWLFLLLCLDSRSGPAQHHGDWRSWGAPLHRRLLFPVHLRDKASELG